MSMDNKALILSCRATIRAYRAMADTHIAVMNQTLQQIARSRALLERTKALPGMKTDGPAENLAQRETAA